MKTYNITQRPLFWAIFVLTFIGSVIFAYTYFSTAFPLVNLNLKMDRQKAIKQADALAKKQGWGPENFQQAITFATDSTTQFFVELEAGGKKAFNAMIKEKRYEPYTWRIRHFKELQKNETVIIFTPEGKPYGFKETIPETTPGESLSVEKARTIAETTASNEWSINLSTYKLIESSKEVRQSKRVDHAFVYEKQHITVGEGRYRLRLVVSGDKLTELNRFVKIPDNFTLRYKEMRSTNDVIHQASFLFIFLFYIIGGLVGLFFLVRSRYVLWRMPLLCGGIIALLQLAANLNAIPTAWFGYDTALSAKYFLFNLLIRITVTSFASFFGVALICMAAESLTRKAFGNHIQFRQLWSKDTASSTAVLGRTMSGYLVGVILIALVTFVYLFIAPSLGWWLPSQLLINPNILATYFPWLSSTSMALSAGFIEECLFRAIPLAGAALLGKRFGRQNLWIMAAFILQVVIFGAAHANYPAQPAYARLLDILIPGCIFGGLYLFYGLLPAILSHFTYDLILMSMPLFMLSTSEGWLCQLPVVLIGLIPLLIVLYARLRTGHFGTLKASKYNFAWQPPAPTIKKVTKPIVVSEKTTLNKITKTIIFIGGLIGLVLWVTCTTFKQEAPRLAVTRSDARILARKELHKRNIVLPDTWQALPVLFNNYKTADIAKNQHQFIWQSDKQLYRRLLGTYIAAPQWYVRFVTFDGTISERSEEYRIFINGEGKVIRFAHIIPEDRSGAHLSEEKARVIAHKQLIEQFGLQAEQLKEISAISIKKPNRMNWTFSFSNPQIYSLEKGEARIIIQISGDTVNDSLRFIHVPEDWQREKRKNENRKNIIKLLCFLLFCIVLIGASIIGKSTRFSLSTALFTFVIFLVYRLFSLFNSWPVLKANFNTSAPFGHQLFMTITAGGIGILLSAGLMALLIGFLYTKRTTRSIWNNKKLLLVSLCLGISTIGFFALITFLKPSIEPLWASLSSLNSYAPIIAIFAHSVTGYILASAGALIILNAINKIMAQYWEKRFLLLVIPFVIAGIIVAGAGTITTIPFWLASGTAGGLLFFVVYHFVLRFDASIVLIIVGMYSIGNLIQQAIFNAYPYALLGNLLAAIAVLMTCLFLFTKVNRQHQQQ